MSNVSLKSPIGIFTTDVNLNITSWNDWLENATGFSEESVRGLPVARVIPDIEKRGLEERFHHVLTNGNVELLSSSFHHYLIKIPLGEPVGRFSEMQQRVTIAPLTDEEIINGTLVTIEDVTDEITKRGTLPFSEGMQDLSSDNWIKRKEAAKQLSSAGKTIISEVLRKIRFEHGNLSILSSAMKAVSMTDAEVSDFLIEFLNDEDKELRIYAAQMLGEKNKPEVIEALLQSLDDPDTNVRYHAIESLGRLKAFQAVERLAEIALSRDFFTAFPAIDALRLIGDNRASRLIHPLMDDKLLGQPVLETLGELSEADVVPFMTERINTNSPLIPYIAGSLARIAMRYQETLGDGAYIADLTRTNITDEGIQNLISSLESTSDNENLNAFITVMGWIDDDRTSKKLTRYLGDPETRKQVIDAFVSSGKKVVDLLISQLDSDQETRQSAIMALGRIGGEKAVDALLPLLRDDDVAVICCGALSKIGDRRAFEDLLGLLGHQNHSVRRAAIAALNSIGHPEMARRVPALMADPNPLIRESALKIAGYFGFPDCRSFVQKLSSDMDLNVRIAAIENLPFYEDDRILSALKRFFLDENPKIRAAVVRSLGQVESKQVYQVLSEGLDDTDSWVRYYAIKSMDMHGFVEVMPKIRETAVNDPVPFVRMAAVEYLGHAGGQVPASILASLAGDANRDVALASIDALGNIHHPDALPPLLALSRSSDTEIKKRAVKAMGKRGGTGTAAALQWLALTEKDTKIREEAVKSLMTISNRDSTGALLNLTADHENRERAISALAGLPGDMIEYIAEGFSHKHTLVRTAVIEVLLRIHSPSASSKLAEALAHDDVNVRLAAVNALHRLGNRTYIKKLLKLKNSDPDPVVRKAIQDIVNGTKT